MVTSDRQREIIEASLELIHAQGIQELTMKRIAAAVGVSEPALYKHFSSKSDILSAVVDELEATRAGALEAARTAGGDPLAVLAAFFGTHARQFAKRPALMAVLFSDDLFRHDQALSTRVASIISGTQEMIRGEIEKGKTAGVLRLDVGGETAALMLAGGFRLLVSAWRLRGASFDLAERTEVFIEQALALLRA
jgi:AcrR family transcriptional regulator